MMSTEQTFDCVFCKEVFENKETLQIHFRKHGDPNFNPTIKKMRSPNETPNEMTAEDNEMVGCDVCDEVFPTISKAITHKHKAHPDHDAKYFCPFCGKLFTMKHLYNKHMMSNHEGGRVLNTREFYCDCCKVNFYAPAAMLHHNKFFHRQDTELQGVGHSKKVKKCHQEMIQIYYCSFCGEEYNNKVNLHKHMVDDHSDENQSPSEILRCPLCEAIFYHLDAYEVHLTFHSTEDIYSERNEMVKEVTEFSLETVAPIMEKVEEEMSEKTEDGAMNSGCIDNFLQLVMGESTDNDGLEKVKSKKHKKHKKSKKAAITLDEFLNMNKDVFGDGLDVQGIEEVPTQAVLRKTKGIKLPVRNEAKVINDLAKLKKQGIIIKTKSNKRATAAPFVKNPKELLVNSAKVANNPNEILSKLSQGNSQIKIVKKSFGQNSASEDDAMELTADTCNEPNDALEKDTSSNKELDMNTSNNHIPNENSLISDNTNEKSETDNFKISENKTEQTSGTNTISKDNNINNDNLKNNTCVAMEVINNKSSALDETRTKVLNPPLQDLNNLKAVLCNKTLDETKKDLLQDYNINTQYGTFSKSDRNINEGDLNEDEDVNEKNSNRGANKTLNALKHLSHSLTVKSVNQPKFLDVYKKNETINKELNSPENANDYPQNNSKHPNTEQRMTKTGPEPLNDLMKNPSFEQHSDFDSDSDFNNDNVNVKQVKLKIKCAPPTPHKILKNTNIKLERNVEDYDDKLKEDSFSKPTSNINILKRLSNVTAKSVSIANNDNKVSNIKINRPIANQVLEMSHKNISEQGMKQEEIFNIDDSDSDGNDHFVHKNEEKQPNVALDSLRNINKNITVKSSQHTNITELKDKKIETKTVQSNRSTEHLTFTKHSSDIQKSINLQNKLKNLGGNITVKSNNPSPGTINKELYKTFEEYDNDDEFDSGSEMNVGKVKITEINEEEMSDNDGFDSESNAIVESPNASNSDNEYNEDDVDDNLADFEDKIKYTAVKKLDEATSKKPTSCLQNFKNLNKNLTIKSLTSKKNDSEDESNTDLQKDFSEDKPLNRQVAIKQFKPNTLQNEQPINRPVTNQPSTSSSQTINKNVTSSNQVNTVKMVKKIQSQTVIEEITTTVTKTIRTVNQTSNEMLQSNMRCGPRPIIRPQKILNRPTNIQGTGIRQSIPTIGTRIRNATHMVRQSTPSAIRPSNQIVPVRPVLFAQRNPTPSTSAIRKTAPPRGSPQRPTIGKLKISPHALNQTMKRSSDEAPGHFSCFKKPKEIFTNDMGHPDDDSMVQYASASHTQSNFSSVTKSVKGMGAVTATQMRSEVSTSSQQLSKLSNVSGLKIVKTSSKQAMQVEEKCDISPAQRNTLNALEKLQKHGLLVKKPRIDDYDEHYSHSESDDETSDK